MPWLKLNLKKIYITKLAHFYRFKKNIQYQCGNDLFYITNRQKSVHPSDQNVKTLRLGTLPGLMNFRSRSRNLAFCFRLYFPALRRADRAGINEDLPRLALGQRVDRSSGNLGCTQLNSNRRILKVKTIR
jgi:hypothetical protein